MDALITGTHPVVEPLIQQLALSHWAVTTNLEGVTHEESLQQPLPGGNCLNWVVGHIVRARNEALSVLSSQDWQDEHTMQYRRGSKPDTPPEEPIDFSELRDALNATYERYLHGLRALSAERLAQKAPFSPANDPNETIGSLMAKFAFHEAYHTGQTGILRRLARKEGAIK